MSRARNGRLIGSTASDGVLTDDEARSCSNLVRSSAVMGSKTLARWFGCVSA